MTAVEVCNPQNKGPQNIHAPIPRTCEYVKLHGTGFCKCLVATDLKKGEIFLFGIFLVSLI